MTHTMNNIDADGYYGDDEVSDEELDLSFLDEKEDEKGKNNSDTTSTPATPDKKSE